ncbi:hypothetical protein AAGT10_14990 (plasmid) [Sulfolobus tengchongensis]|uniref:Uncharacterized protein n=1 Tax=Sulfolobus tengchongensis TaxID=207809 RepID=A0AAX4L6H9_9CREN
MGYASIFKNFVIDAIADLQAAHCLENCLSDDLLFKDEVENRKVFLMAASAEKFSKALMIVYVAVIIFPLIFFYPLKKLEIKEKRVFQKLRSVIRDYIKKSVEVTKLSHAPISNSGLSEVIDKTRILLPNSESDKDLKAAYSDIKDYIDNTGSEYRRYRKFFELTDFLPAIKMARVPLIDS